VPWWGWALGVVGILAVIGVVLLLLRDDDSGSVTEASTTTTETTTVDTTVPETTTIPETTTTESTTTTSSTTTTVAPLTWPPGAQVVVAAADGIHLATDEGDNLAVAEQVTVALALPDGGFLVQDRSGRYAPEGGENNQASTAIRRTNGGVLLAPQAGEWLRLHDVNVVGGEGYALVTIDSGTTPDDMSEDLVLVALDDGAVTPVAPVGGWEAGTSRLSLGADGSIVGEYYVEATSGPLMLRTDGSPLIDPASLGLEGQYSDCATCPHLFSVSPDGRRIGWIENGALVVVDAANGRRQLDGPLPPDLAEHVTGLEIGANELVLNRSDVTTGTAQAGTIIAVIDGSATSFPIPVAGLATLAS
jgi:hypothetical protein